MGTNSNSLQEAQQAKQKELHDQEGKVKELQAQLAKLNEKVNNHQPLSTEDTKFISDLGWLSALSVTIATIAGSM